MKRVYHAQSDILQKPVECCYALGLIWVAQNCSGAGALVACSRENSTCVTSSLRLPPVFCACHDTDLTQTFLTDIFSSSVSLSFSFFLLPLCLVQMDERKNIFPGNLPYLQSSDMAARPLLINSPLNFNRLIINYWGINVQIQLCCPSSIHKCQQRRFTAYAVEYLDSPLTLTSQLSEAEECFLEQVCRQNEREAEIWAEEIFSSA